MAKSLHRRCRYVVNFMNLSFVATPGNFLMPGRNLAQINSLLGPCVLTAAVRDTQQRTAAIDPKRSSTDCIWTVYRATGGGCIMFTQLGGKVALQVLCKIRAYHFALAISRGYQ